MDYELFKKMLESETHKRYPKAKIIWDQARENNGKLHDRMIVNMQDRKASPGLHTDVLFQSYQEAEDKVAAMEEIVKFIDEVIQNKERSHVPTTEELFKPENVILKLINRGRNADLLSNAPHRLLSEEIAVIYRVCVLDEGNQYLTTVDNKLKELIFPTLSEEDLYKIAIENTKRLFPLKVEPFNVFLADSMRESGAPEEICNMIETTLNPMTCITTENRQNGAFCLAMPDVFEAVSDMLGNEDLYIIPSSVHECLAFPTSMTDMNTWQMLQTISEANATVLLPEDVLADQLFIYKQATKEIKPADIKFAA